MKITKTAGMQFIYDTVNPTDPPADPIREAVFYNTVTGFRYQWDIFGQVWSGIPKVYRAIINQVGTNAPTAYVLQNTLGAIITPSYITDGAYGFSSNPNIFTSGKTGVMIGPVADDYTINAWATKQFAGDATVVIGSLLADGTPTNNLFVNCLLEITVSP